MRKLLIGLIAIATLLGGCSFNSHRIDIQQGNTITEAEVARLQHGMTREQVQYIMGTPLVRNPFRAERWDYVYRLRRGSTGEVEQKHVGIHFEGDAVSRIEVDGVARSIPEPETTVDEVEVSPLESDETVQAIPEAAAE